MTKHVSTKRALILSLLSMLLCVSMLVGSTYAWFTDTATTSVNKIQAGTLDVALEMKDGDNWVSAEGKTLNFKTADNREEILWEPGCTYSLPELRVVNKGNLAIKYKVMISGINGDAELNDVIDWTIGDVADGTEKTLAPNGTAEFTITGKMSETAENAYQGMSIDGISIMVYATQAMSEKDSNGDTYDENAGKDTAFYTLKEFNALTEIPEGIKTVYVNLGGASLANGLTVGNTNIADHYNYTNWNDNTAPAGYPYNTGRTNTRESDNAVRYLYSTGKNAVNVILTGSVSGAVDTGNFNAGTIKLMLPDAATVTFDGVTFGAGQMAMGVWSESFQSTVVDHRIKAVVFDGCTFNGNWIQNGAVGADEMTFSGCVFNQYENTASKNNSNPIWIQNMGKCNVTIEGSTFHATRPIKLWEGTASGTVTIKDNKFVMSNFDDATGSDVYKNVAIMFCQSNLDNVVITGNTVSGNATAFLCFYDDADHYPTMNDGATFKVSGNTLNGAKESVLWKTATEWKPNYYNN